MTIMQHPAAKPTDFYKLPLSRVAVVLVDFQNDFCSPDVFKAGDKVTNTKNADAAQRANAFAEKASALGAHVIYTQQILDFAHLTEKQQRWEVPGGLCSPESFGAELFLPPVKGSSVVVKHRYDTWQSRAFLDELASKDIDGLVICGVELICCVLYAILGASERGYHYVVPSDLVSGQDPGDDTENQTVRDFLAHTQPERYVTSAEILQRWGTDLPAR